MTALDTDSDDDIFFDAEGHSEHTEEEIESRDINPEQGNASFFFLPDDLVLQSIWPKIMSAEANFASKCRTIATMSQVCRGWRDWIERVPEYPDYLESYADFLCFQYR